jgi:hypothetical protein
MEGLPKLTTQVVAFVSKGETALCLCVLIIARMAIN